MQELEFLNSIDCKFPYSDIDKWKTLIENALKISDSCVFGIIHELVRPPRSAKVNKKKIDEFLIYISHNFHHNFKSEIINISKKKINWEVIKEEEVLSLMEGVKKYSWLSLALNILYFLVDDKSWNIEKKYNEVIDYWKSITK